MDAEHIVVGGFSCRLPESDSPEEFWQHLLAGSDLLTDDEQRWQHELYKTPPRFGKLKTLDRFDAAFFEVHAKQAHKMDPQQRLLLEVSYEAICDAGLNAEALRGSNTGVFVGACLSDSFSMMGTNSEEISGYENSGCSLSMFANRLSYYFDFHGPSQTIDTACSSSLVALDTAVNAINNGHCDYALVAGSNLILRPEVTVGFNKLGMLSPDGACKSFDKSGNGYARSEGIVVILICKSALACRQLATIAGTGVNSDGHTEQGITFPNSEVQLKLLESVYKQAGIDPADVGYIEAHGTGTQAGDPQELNAIDRFFCAQRKHDKPLLIGAVKSNTGHTEGASGLTGMVKVLLAMQNGTIPGNLHYQTPNPSIPALVEGRIKVIDQATPWNGGIVGINSFGFGGTNAHVVLVHEPVTSASDTHHSFTDIFPLAARTQHGFGQLAEFINSKTQCDAYNTLIPILQNIANKPLKTFSYRGAVYKRHDGSLQTVKAKTAASRPPVWFVFPGMGAQWPGMGAGLLQLPIVSDSIRACHQALLHNKINIDLPTLLQSSDDAAIYDDIVNVFVALTGIQIALVDLLTHLGINADGIVGHSVGEIACAYADGGLSKEQAILTAYWRGQCVKQTPDHRGAMAAISGNWDEVTALCNDKVVAACHNSESSVTVSGETEAVRKLVSQLNENGGDATMVSSTGIAFHSPRIEAAAPGLFKALSEIIPQPLPRSARWVSSSAIAPPQTPDQDLCSAQYFVNNLVSPVRFYQAVQHIPANALLIEIGAHSLMRASLLETVSGCQYVNLMRRDHNNVDTIAEGIVRCFSYGLNINWQKLTAPHFPIENTARIPYFDDWDHTQVWEVPNAREIKSRASSNIERHFNIDIKQDEYAFLVDHKVNGRIVFPGTGYLYLAWRTLSQLQETPLQQLPVSFRHVHFHQATMLSRQRETRLVVRYLPGSNHFEITLDNDLVVSGQMQRDTDGKSNATTDQVTSAPATTRDTLDAQAAYKELRLRGYGYGPSFQRLQQVTLDGLEAQIEWDENWISFLDSLLHFSAIRMDRAPLVPTYIEKLDINPPAPAGKTLICAQVQPYNNQIISPYAVFEGCKFSPMPARADKDTALLHQVQFIPFFESDCIAKAGQTDTLAVDRYAEISQAYILHRFHQCLQQARNSEQPLAAHILELEKLLAPIPYAPPEADALAQCLSHPQGHLIRLARHIYDNSAALLKDAMPVIVGFEDYDKVYKHDFGMAFLLQQPYLGNLIDIVMDNCGKEKPVSICEVGAGTGGLAYHVLPKLRDQQDRYIFTDISAGFFDKLKQQFSDYDAVTRFHSWNLHQAAPAELGRAPDLIMASNVIHATDNIITALQNIKAALSDDSFFLLHEATHAYVSILGIWGYIADLWQMDDREKRTHGAYLSHQDWLNILHEVGFDVIAYKDDGYTHSMFLCRKRRLELPETQVFTYREDDPCAITGLQEAISNTSEKNNGYRLWLQGNVHQAPGLTGLFNCITREPDTQQLRCVFLEDQTDISEQQWLQLQRHDLVSNVFKDGQWGSYGCNNFKPSLTQKTNNAYLAQTLRGDLSSLHWTSAPAQPSNAKEFISTYYSALNFKDIMHASGKLPEDGNNPLGTSFIWEFAGRNSRNERVMGCVLKGSVFTHAGLNKNVQAQMWHIPDDWSMQQAATVPVVYMTAYLALMVRARLQAQDSILIHSGTGGVGQAAIHIALSLGCEVFTTVGSEEKRAYIRQRFPRIAEDHIASSHDTAFLQQILEQTGGNGVNVVLNSLSEDKLQASIKALSRYGRFLEIGRFDMTQNTAIGMEMFMKDISFHGIGLDNVIHDNPKELDQVINCVQQGLDSGVVQPLPQTVFERNRLEQAFRYMARGKHIGKVLLRLQDEASEQLDAFDALKRYWCRPDRAYLITGGLGGFGLELADWLVQRGARHLVLTSRSGISNAYQAYRIKTWNNSGVHVQISQKDVASEQETLALIKDIEKIQPLAAVFHLAMVLSDALFINQSQEQFNRVYAPKLQGARNLDKTTRQNCRQLVNFVVFSSISGSQGNAGQSNYGYANIALDRLCEQRSQQGLPALSVQWGAVGDVGFVHDNADYVKLSFQHIANQSITSCLSALEKFLLQDHPVVSSFTLHDKHLKRSDGKHEQDSTNYTLEDLFINIKSILGLAADHDVDTDIPLSELGLDSLMAVEIRQVLENKYAIKVKLPEIRKLSFAALETFFETVSEEQGQTQQADNSGEQSKPSCIEAYGDETGEQVVYFVNGIMGDPREILAQTPIPENTRLYMLRYERVDTVTQLAEQWLEHIRHLPEPVKSVRIVGYSIGAILVHRLRHIVQTKEHQQDLPQIHYTSISPVYETHIQPLYDTTAESLDKMSEQQAISQVENLPWYGDFKALPYREIIAQSKLLIGDYEQRQQLGTVDLVIIPDNDTLCWNETDATTKAEKVQIVSGTHDLRVIGLGAYLS